MTSGILEGWGGLVRNSILQAKLVILWMLVNIIR